MGEFVYLEVADGIGTIRLNRPKVNALNDQVTAELAEAARGAAASEDVRAVIVYGGEKVFAGGADIEVMAETGYAEMALRSARLQAGSPVIAGQISGAMSAQLAAVLLVRLLTDLGEAEPRDRGQGCDVAGADRGPHGADAGFGGGAAQ